jgi:hypothetical protein
MSRGFGRVERAILKFIYEERFARTDDFVKALFGPGPTASQLASVRRALRRLAADGLVVCCMSHRRHWWLMPRGVPKWLGLPGRGPGPDLRYGFEPTRQRRGQPVPPVDSKGRPLTRDYLANGRRAGLKGSLRKMAGNLRSEYC